MKILNYFMLALVVFFAGCAHVKSTHEAKLMPEETAKIILSKYFGWQWVSNPYGIVTGLHRFLCNEKYPLPFSEINMVFIGSKGVTVGKQDANIFSCEAQLFWSSNRSNLTEEDQDDIKDALVSLGANLSEKK